MRVEKFDNLTFYNCDNMEIMKNTPDKYFEIALIDPPYGIGEDGSKNHTRSKLAKAKDYKAYSSGDKIPPTKEFFKELIRISQNQIIWGANHFISLIPFDSSCWIVWDKNNGESDFADCELAFTSFHTAVRLFKWTWAGMLQQNMKDKQVRIHPNEKPIQLYKWILKNYAKKGDKILDTHLGSNSIGIAIDEMNQLDKMDFEFTGIELDEEYFEKSIQRFKNYKSQYKLF